MIHNSVELNNQNKSPYLEGPLGRVIHFDYSIPTYCLSFTEHTGVKLQTFLRKICNGTQKPLQIFPHTISTVIGFVFIYSYQRDIDTIGANVCLQKLFYMEF